MSLASDRLYERFGPLATYDDENGGIVQAISDALAAPQAVVDDVARESDTHAPWQAVLDPDACPAAWLPWLAQFAGVKLLPSDDEAQQRQRIKTAAGFYRGTDSSMIADVAATLTGTRHVDYLTNVSGDPWSQTIVTLASETPDPAATTRAAMAQKPAGVVLLVLTTNTPIIDQGTRTIDAGAATIDTATAANVT